MESRPRRIGRWLALVGTAGLAMLACSGAHAQRTPGPPPGDIGLSLLAVGDTGKAPDARPRPDPQVAVAGAMADEHRQRPVAGVVLLGDNFYPEGLKEREFKDRLRLNIVRPYCPFLRFTSRGEGG